MLTTMFLLHFDAAAAAFMSFDAFADFHCFTPP
jgi:hypothetical protein